MHGKLDPDERIMEQDSLAEQIGKAINKLGWESTDNIAVEIGGTSVYEIEGAGTKWAPTKGTRKYNKDAFIVIKNLDRNLTISSQPFAEGEFKPAHPHEHPIHDC